MKTRNTLSFACSLVLMLAVMVSPAYSTQPTYGEISMTFSEPLAPNQPWNIRIWAKTYLEFANGKLTLLLRQANGKEIKEVDLWSGGRKQSDTVVAEYTIDPLPLGNYQLSAELVAFPDGNMAPGVFSRGASYVIFYITIREHKVYIGRTDWVDNFRQEIMDELDARGLKGVSGEEVQEKAPDLAERLRNLRSGRPTAPVDAVHEPPKQRPTLDSSKGIIFGGVKQGIHMQGTGDEVKYNPPKHPPTRTGRQPAYPYDKPSIDPPRERPAPPVRPEEDTTQATKAIPPPGRGIVRVPVEVEESKSDSADTLESPP